MFSLQLYFMYSALYYVSMFSPTFEHWMKDGAFFTSEMKLVSIFLLSLNLCFPYKLNIKNAITL